jgi:hypothetical protein
VAINRTDGVAALSGHCWHVDREVFVRYQKLRHVCSRLDDTFSDCLLVVATTSPYRDRLCTSTVCMWVGRRQQP